MGTETWLKIIGGLLAILHFVMLYVWQLHNENRKELNQLKSDVVLISQLDKVESRLDKQHNELKQMQIREIDILRDDISELKDDINGVANRLTNSINDVGNNLKEFIRNNSEHQEQVTALILRIIPNDNHKA